MLTVAVLSLLLVSLGHIGAQTTWDDVSYCTDTAKFCIPSSGGPYWSPLPPPNPPCDVQQWENRRCQLILYGALRINGPCATPTDSPTASISVPPTGAASISPTVSLTDILTSGPTAQLTIAATASLTDTQTSGVTTQPTDIVTALLTTAPTSGLTVPSTESVTAPETAPP